LGILPAVFRALYFYFVDGKEILAMYAEHKDTFLEIVYEVANADYSVEMEAIETQLAFENFVEDSIDWKLELNKRLGILKGRRFLDLARKFLSESGISIASRVINIFKELAYNEWMAIHDS